MAVTMNPMSDPRQVWDNLEQTNYELGHRGTNAQYGLVIAKRRALSQHELFASNGVYTGNDLVWLVPVEMAPQLKCKPADVVVDFQDNRWTVLDASLNTWRTWYRLTCRNLSLHFDLRDKLDIEHPAQEIDAAGAYVQRFPTGPAPNGGEVLYRDLACRVQPTSDDIVDGRGIRGEQINYHIVVDRQLVVDVAKDRVRWLDSKGTVHYLDITRYVNAESISELPVIEALEKP